MRIVSTLIVAAALAAAFPHEARADELPLGNWNGFAVRLNTGNQNRQPRVLVVRKVADPHVAWRGGSGELLSVSFGQNQNNMNEVSAIALADGRLTFTVPVGDQVLTCMLVHQPKENAYVGDCSGANDFRVTLNPPPPPALTPAAATPAEAK